jgi:hypothetical protein
MLRHACGYALANKGHDTRALQAYLGHKTFSTRCATLSCRRLDSRIFGVNRLLHDKAYDISGFINSIYTATTRPRA